MNRAALVALRELVENVRTKGFWIGIMMLPIMMAMVALLPMLVESTREAKRFTVIDESGWLLQATQERITANGPQDRFEYVPLDGRDPQALNEAIARGDLFAYFVIGKEPVESNDGMRYVSNNLTDRDLLSWFSNHASSEVRVRKLQRENLTEEVANWIGRPVEFEGVQIAEGGVEEEVDTQDIVRQWTPVAFVYLLWISILINTQMLLTNTIEEKSNKLIEVLLSSISPIQLMAGKILGIAATGLAIIIAWSLMALFFFVLLPDLANVDMPIDISDIISDPVFLGSFLVYFILGYLFYAALLVGLGSVCTNLKDAQNLMLPVQLVQMIPIFIMVPIGQDPNGILAKTLSYIPPLTPFVMMNRAAAPPTLFEYVVTTALLIASIAAALWFAAKIFRIGILLTGKPPSFLEIMRWFRTPVTKVNAAP